MISYATLEQSDESIICPPLKFWQLQYWVVMHQAVERNQVEWDYRR